MAQIFPLFDLVFVFLDANKIEKGGLPQTPLIHSVSEINVESGILIAINSGDHSPVNSQGTKTMSLKRRKKRKDLNVDENCVSSADVPSQVEVFYFTLQQNPAPKRRRSSKTELPPFIQLDGVYLSYDQFYESFKPRGEVFDVTMSAYSHVFNSQQTKPPSDVLFRKKIVFSPFIMRKLLLRNDLFQPRSILKELRSFQESVKFSNEDLLFFSYRER